MKKLFILLMLTAFAYVGCEKQPIETTQIITIDQADAFIQESIAKGITEWAAPGNEVLREFDKTNIRDTSIIEHYKSGQLETRAAPCTIEQFWASDAVSTLTGGVYLSVYHDSQLIYYTIADPSQLYSGVGRTIGTSYTSGTWKVRAQPLAGGYSYWNPGTVYIGVYWPSSGSWGVNNVYCCQTLVSNDHYYSSCNL